jgi:hypothetical protein
MSDKESSLAPDLTDTEEELTLDLTDGQPESKRQQIDYKK